jgi:hypothetical protein
MGFANRYRIDLQPMVMQGMRKISDMPRPGIAERNSGPFSGKGGEMLLTVRDACDVHDHVLRADAAPEIDDLIEALVRRWISGARSRDRQRDHEKQRPSTLKLRTLPLWACYHRQIEHDQVACSRCDLQLGGIDPTCFGRRGGGAIA